MRISMPNINLSKLRAYARADHGATSIEYSLIAVLICVAIIGALNLFADNMGNMFDSISNAVSS